MEPTATTPTAVPIAPSLTTPPSATPAPSVPSGQERVSPVDMTPNQRADWKRTGKIPTRAAAPDAEPTTPESAPDEPDIQAASTEAQSSQPASEPGPSVTPQPKKKGAEARTEQLRRENAALQEELRLRKLLREELAALPAASTPKSGAAPASPAAETKASAWERFKSLPGAPKIEQYTDLSEFIADQGAFVTQALFNEQQTRAAQSAGERRVQESLERYEKTAQENVAAYLKEHPGAHEGIDPGLGQIPSFRTLPRQVVNQLKATEEGRYHLNAAVLMDRIMDSGVIVPLMLHFSSPEGKAEFAALCKGDVQAIPYRLGQISATVGTEASRSPQTVSAAPDPPATLGRQPSPPQNELRAAIKSNDHARFREMRAKQTARR